MSTQHPSVKVALGSEFLTAYARLPQSQQKKVREFCDKFMQNPASPGINYERLQAARDANLRSVRIDQNYRGIVLQPERGGPVTITLADIVSGKPVPPRPSVRHRVTPLACQHHGLHLFSDLVT